MKRPNKKITELHTLTLFSRFSLLMPNMFFVIHAIQLTTPFFIPSKNACDRAACENGGTCQSGFTDKGYRCICAPNFFSAHCEKGIGNCKAIRSSSFFFCYKDSSTNNLMLLKGNSQLVHMRIRYHFVANLHITLHLKKRV